MNDYLSRESPGPSGAGCSGAACGSLSNVTSSLSPTMHPPPFQSCHRSPLTATSVNDTSKKFHCHDHRYGGGLPRAPRPCRSPDGHAAGGVTLLSFEVSVTGATLDPGNVDLLGGKGQFRLK